MCAQLRVTLAVLVALIIGHFYKLLHELLPIINQYTIKQLYTSTTRFHVLSVCITA